MSDDQNVSGADTIELATDLTVAWLSNPNINASADAVPAFLQAVHAAIEDLANADKGVASSEKVYLPAVPIRSSVKPDYLISLIDGRKFKSLKRHLAINGLTPAEYRERYGLKPDYPMAAPNYSAHRREVAKKLGLGRKQDVKGDEATSKSNSVSAKGTDAVAATKSAKPVPRAKLKLSL